MLPEEKNYVYGSAAPKIDYDVYEENKVLKAKKKQRANNKIKVKLVFAILALFAAFLSVILMYAKITEVNYDLNKKNKEYNDKKNANIQLRLEIQKNLDLNRIKEIALTRLDMQEPDKYQVVYVRVPKKDVMKVAAIDGKNAEDKGVINLVSDVVSDITNFFD